MTSEEYQTMKRIADLLEQILAALKAKPSGAEDRFHQNTGGNEDG